MSTKISLIFASFLTLFMISAHMMPPEMPKNEKNVGLTKIQAAATSPERTFDLTEEMKNTNRMNVTGTAVCKDSQIAGFLNYAMSYYIHNMDGLSSYVLDQIQRARKPGKWLVHSQIIATSRQGPDWQTKTNGDVFSQPPNNWYACYYHDTQTYILVLRLY